MNDEASPHFKPLTLPGRMDSIRVIGEYILQVANEVDLPQAAAYRLRLAVEEIATNAVVHGYQETQREGDLLVSASADSCQLSIVIEDTGPAYDPRQTPMPDDLDRPLDERPEGGLGVFLALMGVDEYDYQREGKSNRHIFIQYRKR